MNEDKIAENAGIIAELLKDCPQEIIDFGDRIIRMREIDCLTGVLATEVQSPEHEVPSISDGYAGEKRALMITGDLRKSIEAKLKELISKL